MITKFEVRCPDNMVYTTPRLRDGRVNLSDDGESVTILDDEAIIAIFKQDEWLSVVGVSDEAA